MAADPSDFKFSPTDERLVGYYLRNRVDTGKDGFITDIKLYEYEPWLLPHVKNDQFKEKKWFYFDVRKRRSRNVPMRTVPGRGGSYGGTWSATGRKEKILDGDNKVVIGYKRELAYHMKLDGKKKGNTKATGWCMTEYWLASEKDAEFQEVVLCHLRAEKNKKVKGIAVKVDQSQFHPEINNGDNNIVEQPPLENKDDKNNMVSNALIVSGVELDSGLGLQNIERDDRFMVDIDEQQPLIPPLQDQDSRFTRDQDMISPLQGQDSRFPVQNMTPAGEGEGLGLQDMKEYVDELENMLMLEEDDDRLMFDIAELLDFTHQQQPLIPPLQDQDSRFTRDQDMISPLQGQDSRFPVQNMTPAGEGEGLELQDMKEYADELENMLEEDDDDKATQQQYPQIPLPPQGQDSGSINNHLVVMEDEFVNQDGIFNQQADITQPQQQQEMMIDSCGDMSSTRLEMENNLIYVQDSWDQEMSPWNNMMTTNPFGVVYNTHGYEMQEPHATNGVNRDSYY